MATVIALVNEKGGVGKTTSTVNIAAALGFQDKRVLVIDMDPQGSLTRAVGGAPKEFGEMRRTIREVLLENKPLKEVIFKTHALPAVAPSYKTLADAVIGLNEKPDKLHVLKRHIATVSDQYDYILIDCPPSNSLLSQNAIAAADGVIIPFEAALLSVSGIESLLETIKEISHEANPSLEIIGFVPTRLDSRTKSLREYIAYAQSKIGSIAPVFEPIRTSVLFNHAELQAIPAFFLRQNNNPALDYLPIANHLTKHYG